MIKVIIKPKTLELLKENLKKKKNCDLESDRVLRCDPEARTADAAAFLSWTSSALTAVAPKGP